MTEKQEFFTIMGGRVKMRRSLYNPTSDSVWLAAFINDSPKTVLDVGTGSGAVALCLMARVSDINMTAIDISDEMLTAAKENFELNKKKAEFIHADILNWHTNKTFDLVITNPPYFKGTPAHHNAHHNADLATWTRKCIARVKPNGMFATVIAPSEIPTVMHEMTHHCGDFQILPLFSNKNTAERVLLSARVGRAPGARIFNGISMNCDAILRDGQSVESVLNQSKENQTQTGTIAQVL